MAYQALARRYRPSAFSEVIGQGHVAQTLCNAIKGGRIAHAYLFCGPHGCGKTSMARIFAKALNCTGGPSADIPADCPISRDISAGNDPDVMEIDGASNNGVEQVRTLREQAAYMPSRSRFKIYIIDEVHMLSVPAFNALLKTLEEPPAHVKFILATTEAHRLLETVLSRCQRFDFRLVPPPEISAHLKQLCEKEGVPATPEALEAIAAFAGGSVRDALVLLDQLLSFCPNGIQREDVERMRGAASSETVAGIYDAILTRDCKAALALVDKVAQQGAGPGEFLDQLIDYGRDLMLVSVTSSLEGVSAYGPARQRLSAHAKASGLEKALLMLDVFCQARTRVRSRALANPQVPLEMAVARLAGLEGIESIGAAVARIEELAQSGALSGGLDISALIDSNRVTGNAPTPAALASATQAPTSALVPAAAPAAAIVTPQPASPVAAPIPVPAPTATPVLSPVAEQVAMPAASAPVSPAASEAVVKSVTAVPEIQKPAQPVAQPIAAATPPPAPAVEPVPSQPAPAIEVNSAVASNVDESSGFAAVSATMSGFKHKENDAASAEDAANSDPDGAAAAESSPCSPLAEGQELNLAEVRRRWDSFAAEVAAGNIDDKRYLHDIDPVGVDGNAVMLSIPAGGVWLMEQLEESSRRQRLEQAMSRAIGRPVPLKMRLEEGSAEKASAGEDEQDEGAPAPAAETPAAKPATTTEKQRDALGDPLIRQVLEAFGGTVQNVS